VISIFRDQPGHIIQWRKKREKMEEGITGVAGGRTLDCMQSRMAMH